MAECQWIFTETRRDVYGPKIDSVIVHYEP